MAKAAAGKQRDSSEPTMLVAELLEMAAPYNPRTIDDVELQSLRSSLRTFGAVQPVVWNKRTGNIVGGVQRVKAAKLEGWESFPTREVDIDESSEMQLNLALNRISGRWDDEKLNAVILSLRDGGADLSLTGFRDRELQVLLELHSTTGATHPDAVPDAPERAKPGELWQLGRHRLLCGDATNEADVKRLLDGAAPTVCVTDPPYGINYDPQWRVEAARDGLIHSTPRAGERLANDDRVDWSDAWRLVPGDVLYVWHAPGERQLHAGIAIRDSSPFDIRSTLIWAKSHFPISRGHYKGRHEPCFYAVRRGAKAHWIGPVNADTLLSATLDANVLGGHSTQKPVALFELLIRNHEGDVYDPFVGSGTCVIASERIARTCFAMEIEHRYCDTVLARWDAYAPDQAAERIEAGA